MTSLFFGNHRFGQGCWRRARCRMEPELAAVTTIPAATTWMASAATLGGNEKTSLVPTMNITAETLESVYFTVSSWRTPKTYPALTEAERSEYYKTYDPLTGVKIAATLSGLLTMAVLYVFYKVGVTRCPIFNSLH